MNERFHASSYLYSKMLLSQIHAGMLGLYVKIQIDQGIEQVWVRDFHSLGGAYRIYASAYDSLVCCTEASFTCPERARVQLWPHVMLAGARNVHC